jgi:hypothetical protein
MRPNVATALGGVETAAETVEGIAAVAVETAVDGVETAGGIGAAAIAIAGRSPGRTG